MALGYREGLVGGEMRGGEEGMLAGCLGKKWLIGREGLVGFISSPNSSMYLARVDSFMNVFLAFTRHLQTMCPTLPLADMHLLSVHCLSLYGIVRSLKSLNCKMCCYYNNMMPKTHSKIERSECSRQLRSPSTQAVCQSEATFWRR